MDAALLAEYEAMNRHDLSRFFRPVDDEEMESAPQGMKEKWRIKASTLMKPGDGDEVADEDAAASRWQDIPMELLLRILSLVDFRTVLVASGVCTAWREAMSSGVIDLSFSWCGKNVSQLVCSVVPKFPRLKSCNLRRCTMLNDQAIRAVAQSCPDLVCLDLSNGISKGTRLTDVSLTSLAQGCKQLQVLDLSGCTGITEAGLVALAGSCKQLKHLNLCGCHNALTDNAAMAIAHNCNRLQVLNAGWCDSVTDTGIVAIAICCPDLRGLDLCGCHLITDRSVMALAERCHRLRLLGLHCCRNITDLSMYSLVNSTKYRRMAHTDNPVSSSNSNSNSNSSTRSSKDSCSSGWSSSSSNNDSSNSGSAGKLTTLLLGEAQDEGLVSLNLSGCTALSGRAVQAVCDSFPALHTCPERHSLNISGCTGLTSVHCRCAAAAAEARRLGFLRPLVHI